MDRTLDVHVSDLDVQYYWVALAMELSSVIVISSESELEVQAGASTPVLSSQFTPTKRPPSSSGSRLAPWTVC